MEMKVNVMPLEVTSQMSVISNTSMVAMRTCVLTLGHDSEVACGDRSAKNIYLLM
jgi:hypothetical protein